MAARPPRTAAPSQTTEEQRPNPVLRLSAPSGVLRLRAEPEERRHIQWAEDVVDNEGLGRKSSKVCCIYHAPRSADESSDESSSDSSSDSDSEPDNSAARPSASGRRKVESHGHGHDHNHDHGDACAHDEGAQVRKGKGKAKQKRAPSPNAYEKVPKVKK